MCGILLRNLNYYTSVLIMSKIKFTKGIAAVGANLIAKALRFV